jgi:hypothetical protein
MRARFHAVGRVVAGVGIAFATSMAPVGSAAFGASQTADSSSFVLASCQPTSSSGDDLAIDSTDSVAQPFMPSSDGALADVQVAVNLNIYGSPSSIPPLVVSVDAFDPSTGQPGATLASAVVPSSSVPTTYPAPPMTTADFDTPANLTSGASYAIVLSSSASINGSGSDYRWLFAQNACKNFLHASVGPSGWTSTFSPVGDNSASFVVDAQPPAQTPEAPVVVAFPVLGLTAAGVATVRSRRKRIQATGATP